MSKLGEDVRITIDGYEDSQVIKGTIIHAVGTNGDGPRLYVVLRNFQISPGHAIGNPGVFQTLLNLGAVRELKEGVVRVNVGGAPQFTNGKQNILIHPARGTD